MVQYVFKHVSVTTGSRIVQQPNNIYLKAEWTEVDNDDVLENN